MIAQDWGDQDDSSVAARAFRNTWIGSGGFIFVSFTSLVVFDVLQDFSDDRTTQLTLQDMGEGGG